MRPLASSLLALALSVATPADAELFRAGPVSASGDVRVRLETDWDSRTSTGVERDDRTRLWLRLRAGLTFEPSEHFRAEVRLRSGQPESQQSPHVTLIDFDGNDRGEASLDLDRWYLRAGVGGFEVWVGRHDLPFWKQDEFLLDSDVTLPGLGLRYGTAAGPGRLTLAAGSYVLPVGMRRFSGRMAGAQVAYQPEIGGVRWAAAAGIYRFDADRDDEDGARLLQGNGGRDYDIFSASFQGRRKLGGRPLVVGADIMTNGERYEPSDPDPVTAANVDRTDGWVGLVTYGDLDEKGRWLVGYFRIRLETLAVANSWSQDDWVRWGSATQTRGSDLRGHELRLGWAFTPDINIVARLYLADSITTVEDGKRLRVDLNYRF